MNGTYKIKEKAKTSAWDYCSIIGVMLILPIMLSFLLCTGLDDE